MEILCVHICIKLRLPIKNVCTCMLHIFNSKTTATDTMIYTLILNKQANTCLISFYKRVPMMGTSYS